MVGQQVARVIACQSVAAQGCITSDKGVSEREREVVVQEKKIGYLLVLRVLRPPHLVILQERTRSTYTHQGIIAEG